MIAFDALPLEKYSSLHTISLLSLLGIKMKTSPRLKMAFNFNLSLPQSIDPQAHLTFSFRDSQATPLLKKADFSIRDIKRWRLHLAQYASFEDFLEKIKRCDFKRYNKTIKIFENLGATLTLIEDDWSHYAEAVYKLYVKVAEKHGSRLYDWNFFQAIARRSDYKLMCVWLDGSLVAALVIVDEGPILHSMLCCLDYEGSKKTQAYSRMHYELIRLGFERKQYSSVDIGLTANTAKSQLGFQPVDVCMDVYAQSIFLKGLLRLVSCFLIPSINGEARLVFKLKYS